MFRAKFVSTAVCAVFLVFTTVFTAFGQDLDDVVISGKVVDANNAIVVGATVTVTYTATNVSRTTTTNADGRYRLIELQPGEYIIKVTADGFADQTKTGLKTVSGQGVQLDFKLSPAGVTAETTVEISGDNAPLIDTTRTIVGNTLTAEQVIEIPNTTNDVLDLVYAVAGTAEEPFSIRNLASDDRIGGGSDRDQSSEVLGAGSVSLSGGAAFSTNITIDGLDNNDDRAAEFRFQPPVDSVAEIQVIRNQFSAEYGRASGGRINIRTKGGTRKFSGRAFLFFEDESLNANTYNNNRRGLSRLPFSEWEPGATLGGPIPVGYFKDKTFFYSSYTYRDRAANLLIFSALPVDQNPLYPLPQPTGGTPRPDDIPGDNDNFPLVQIAPFITQVDTPAKRHRFTQRIDHNFNERHNLTFSYQLGRSDNFRQFRETSRFLPETIQGRIRNNDSFYITDNYIISNTVVNQFRFQYSNFRPDFATDGTQDPVVLMFVSDDSLDSQDPNRVRGTVVIGNSTSNFASLRKETRYQFQNTLNWVKGDMNWRFGFDAQRIISDNQNLRDATGTFNFWRVADFLSNQPSRYRRNFGAASILRNNYVGGFIQNDWRIRSNLTLALGLRYERESLVEDNNNFGPRVSLAWSPGSDGKSVVRIGGGMFYNRVLLRTLDDYTLGFETRFFDSEDLDGPGNESNCLNGPSPTDAATDKCRFLARLASEWPAPPDEQGLRNILSELGITNGGFSTTTNFTRLIQDGIDIPESYQFNVGYERELGKGFVFETDFTYNKAVRLWRETNINAFQVPDGFNNFTEYLVSLGDTSINGVLTSFFVGTPDDPDTDIVNGVRRVNLGTLSSSFAASSPISIAFDALEANLVRPFDNTLEQVESVGSNGQSVYEGLTFQLRRRIRDLGYGFRSSFNFTYSISRNRDDGFVDTSSAQLAGDFRNEFSRSSIDRRHKFRFSGTTDVPNWLGGLRFSPFLRVESSRPFNISVGRDRSLDDVRNDRPNFSGDVSDIRWRHPNDPLPQALVDQFSLAPIGTPGNLGRNAGTGPALFIFDLNVSREFRFGERIRIRPQLSFDNILNATVFSFGSDFIDLDDEGTDEFDQGFFVPTRTFRQRRIQAGIRLFF